MNKAERIAASAFNAELKLKGFKAYEVDSKAGGHQYNRAASFYAGYFEELTPEQMISNWQPASLGR